MILTIVGANFEGANIGQNKNVTITLTKGNGVSGSKVSSLTLEKNQVVSTATVIATGLSLQTGYKDLVVTVTMNDSTVSGWFSNGTVTIPSGTTITGNIKITAIATATSGGEVVDPEQPGTGGDSGETILLIGNLKDLSTLTASQYGPTQGKNGSSFIERTNIETGKFIEYIDFYAMQPNKSLPTESVNIANLKIYFVDSSTDTVKEMVFDESNYSSQNIDGVQMFRCNINKTTTYTTNIGITVNYGYETFANLNSIPYISFAAGSNLEKPYFGGVISIDSSYAGKTSSYYCPMNIYGK